MGSGSLPEEARSRQAQRAAARRKILEILAWKQKRHAFFPPARGEA
jgi:hypothetical protein